MKAQTEDCEANTLGRSMEILYRKLHLLNFPAQIFSCLVKHIGAKDNTTYSEILDYCNIINHGKNITREQALKGMQ